MESHEYKEKKSDILMNKYCKMFNRFPSIPSEDELTSIVMSLFNRCLKKNFTSDVLKTIHSCIDVTTLAASDTKDTVGNMVDKVVNKLEMRHPDIPNVAAVCVYPVFVDTVKQALTTQDVKIASVSGGFPSSQTFTEVKMTETTMAVMAGADEIDVVMNLGYFLEEEYEKLTDELDKIKGCCRGAKMKVILETGALESAENIRKASILAIYAGADFIKTSTGKGYPGASPEAVYIMCQVIKEFVEISGLKVGIKISGGIHTAEDAVRYYTVVKEVLGEEWMDKNLFRIGASKLTDDIENYFVRSEK